MYTLLQIDVFAALLSSHAFGGGGHGSVTRAHFAFSLREHGGPSGYIPQHLPL